MLEALAELIKGAAQLAIGLALMALMIGVSVAPAKTATFVGIFTPEQAAELQ